MNYSVLAVGLLLCATGLATFLLPAKLRDALVWFSSGGRLALAVFGRLAVGLIVLLGASQTRWPEAAIALGLLFLAAGAAIPVLGEERADRIATWWLARSDLALRSWSCVVILIGGFITWLASPDLG